jgi:ribosome recycling factor
MNQADIQKFEKCIEHLKHELSALRIGRASAALVDSLMVESYGESVPLSHIASISTPDSRTIAIQPWDKANIVAIEKAIQASNLGLNPSNDGNLIRLSIPQMTEERRKEMVKVVSHLGEQARIAMRVARDEILKALKQQEDKNAITKDDLESEKKKLQEEVDKFNAMIKDIVTLKEKEIMTI